MKRLTIGLAVLFIAALFAHTAGAAITYNVADYFPMMDTDSRTYIGGIVSPSTNSVNGTKTVYGRIAKCVFYSSDNSEEYYTIDSSGFAMHGMAGYMPIYGVATWTEFLYSSALPITPVAVQANTSYNYSTTGYMNFTYAGQQYSYPITALSSITVNGLEDVTNNAGIIFRDSLKVTLTLTLQFPDDSGSIVATQQLWLYKNIGPIKQYYTNPNTGLPVTSLIQSATTHYTSGGKKAELLSAVDPSGFIYYEYLDESAGRISKRQKTDGSYDLLEYWTTTSTIKYVRNYNPSDQLLTTSENNSSGVLIKKTMADGTIYTYYASSKLESITLATIDANGNIYYHYIDEIAGRMDKSKRSVADTDGCLSYAYSYSATTPSRVITKIGYSDAAWSTIKLTQTYYDNTANRLESKTLATIDANGYIYFEYANDSYNRASRRQKADGSYDLIISYWTTTSVICAIEKYSATDIHVASETYNSSGVLGTRVEYYASGNLKSWSDSSWGRGMTFTYEDLDYYDCKSTASYDGHGRGRVISEIRVNDDGGTTTKIYEYYDDTLILKKQEVTTTDSVGNVIGNQSESYTYYDEDPWANPIFSSDAQDNKYVSALIPGESGSWKARVIKYNSSWAYQWAAEYDAVGSSANAINAVGSNGNVYLAATKWETDGGHVIVYKFNTATGAQVGIPYLYPVSVDSGSNVPAYIKVDSSDNIFIMGITMTGGTPDNSLFLIKLNSDLTEQWVRTYATGDGSNGDHGGYITFGTNGDIIVHAAQHKSDAFPEYYQIAYDINGTQKSVEPDSVGRCFNIGSPWFGREYTCVDSDGTYYSLGFVEGTGKTIIDRSPEDVTVSEGFPSDFGAITVFNYINTANEDIGYRIEFENNNTIVEGVPNDGGWLPTKFKNYYFENHIGSTWWLFWDVNHTYVDGKLTVTNGGGQYIAIEKTSTGPYNAYTFTKPGKDSTVSSVMASIVSIGVVTDLGSLTLPELGSWEEYNALHNITVEYPPLSTDYTPDPLDPTRVIERLDHNDYNNVKYTYTWDPNHGKVAEKIYYEKGGAFKLASITHYINGSNFDIAKKGTWTVENTITYYTSGNLKSYQTYYNDGNNRYVFEDSNYYSVDGVRGQGRLLRWEYNDGNGNTNFNEFEYYGDTLNIKKIIRPVWENNDIVPGSSEEEIFYNEELVKNPRTATDSEGNTIVATLIIGDEYGNPKAYVVKYGPTGGILWRKEFDTYLTSFNVVVTVDNNDNVYVAASKWNNSNSDVLVYGYEKDGDPIGSYQYNGGDEEQVTSIITDSSGNVYIAGERWQRLDQDNTRDLFIVKLNPDMTYAWSDVYNSAYKDYGGYLAINQAGNIVLHGASEGASFEYFKVAYTSGGTALPVEYDSLEKISGSGWLGAWNSGREYQGTETRDGTTQIWRELGYKHGTGVSIVEYIEGGVEYFPTLYGGMTAYIFIDPASETARDIGAYAEFENGMTGEARFGEEDEFYITKVIGLDLNTYWFLWDVEYTYEEGTGALTITGGGSSYIVIGKTPEEGQYTAYTFDNEAEDFESLMDNWGDIGIISNPEGINFPELHDWWQYCRENNIIPEFPALSSDAPTTDQRGRVIQRIDHNDFMTNVINDYTWDASSIYLTKYQISYDYGKDGTIKLVTTRVYFNYFGSDISNMNNWYLISETNNLTGVTVEHAEYEYASGKMVKLTLETGEQMQVSYYASNNKKEEIFLGSSGVRARSIVYYDVSPSVMKIDKFYESDGTLYETKEYFSDGTTLRYHWMLDQDGTPNGDVVFREYSSSGQLIKTVDDMGVTKTYGSGDIFGDFTGQGFWKYADSKWTKLSTYNADSFMLSDGYNGSYDVIGDFGTKGFYRYSNSAWTKLSTLNADSFLLSDQRIGGTYDIVGDFGSSGFYRYSNDAWNKLSTYNADSFALSALYNDSYDIVGDFGAKGFYRYSDSAWTKLSTLNAESFLLSDRRTDGTYDILGDFGTSGFYRYSNDVWAKISTLNADSFKLSALFNDNYDIVGDFGSRGFYRYSDSTWEKLSTFNADSFILTESDDSGSYDIIADFGSNGFWKHSSDAWTKLSTYNADPEVSERLDINNQIMGYGKVAEGGFTSTSAMAGGPKGVVDPIN